jgi:Tol biopolymer transport system component
MRSSALVGLVALLTVVLAAPPASATFPGTNGKIAFYYFNGQPPQIAVMDPNGDNLDILTSTAHRANFDPAWSADGTKIAFDTIVRGGTPKVRTMDADGTNQTIVASMSSTYIDVFHPSWSPDGTQIVFCALNQRHHTKIFVVDADGLSTPVKLSPKGAEDCSPDWSPDGTTIAFSSSDSVTGATEIMTMDTAGGSRTALAKGFSPSWSPDGTQIVFLKPAHKRDDVFVMTADGSATTRVTATAKRWEFQPVFSPDGTQIAFSRTIGGHLYDTDDVWIFTISGATFDQITDTPKKDEFGVNWQPIPIP